MWPSLEIWRGDRRCETTRATCGAVADVADRVGGGDLERRRPGLERRAREDDDQRRRRRTQLGLEERLGPRRFEVVEDEPAGAELAGDLRRERERDRAAGRPTRRRPTRLDARRSGRADRRGSRLGFASDSTTDEDARQSYPRRLGDPFRASRPSASIGPCSSSWSPSSSRSRSGSRPAIVILMIYIILRSAMTAEGGSSWVRKITNPNAKFLFTFLFIALGGRLRDRPPARAAHGRQLALRRDRPDRPVQRLLHHDGLPLGGDRGVARVASDVTVPSPRGAPRQRRRHALDLDRLRSCPGHAASGVRSSTWPLIPTRPLATVRGPPDRVLPRPRRASGMDAPHPPSQGRFLGPVRRSRRGRRCVAGRHRAARGREESGIADLALLGPIRPISIGTLCRPAFGRCREHLDVGFVAVVPRTDRAVGFAREQRRGLVAGGWAARWRRCRSARAAGPGRGPDQSAATLTIGPVDRRETIALSSRHMQTA